MRALVSLLFVAWLQVAANAELRVTASSERADSPASAAFDGDKFGTNRVWRGGAGTNWFWQVDFGKRETVGAVSEVLGDRDFVFQNAPKDYRWLSSAEGKTWAPIAGGIVTNEQRLLRTLRFQRPIETRFLRMEISTASGEYPAIREITLGEAVPEWILVLNITDDPKLPGEGKQFIPLARKTKSDFLPAQQVWLDVFDNAFLEMEPKPLCVFISGSFKDWCEVRREDFRGLANVLKAGRAPIWASCGGAQALAIIAENGVETAWDCPHCRDAANPKTPIYTHIGHTAHKKCGDYSGCIFERGPHTVAMVDDDPAFAGLAREFTVMESHCGQIAFLPVGWEWLVGPGRETTTKHQAFRRVDRPIYAAQFHIELDGAPESSEQIMRNFLGVARAWKP